MNWIKINALWLVALLVALGIGFVAGRWRRPSYHYSTMRVLNHEYQIRTEDPSGKTWTLSSLGQWE